MMVPILTYKKHLVCKQKLGGNRFFEASQLCIGAQHNIVTYNILVKKTGKRWTISLIQKLWLVSWDMWRFRNGIQHSQSTTVPTNFSFLLMPTIISELNHGHRLFPPSCDYLFTNATSLLRGSINNQKLWIAIVWSARDRYSLADIICQSRNRVVESFVVAWRK